MSEGREEPEDDERDEAEEGDWLAEAYYATPAGRGDEEDEDEESEEDDPYLPYTRLLRGELRIESWLVALLPEGGPAPQVREVLARLEELQREGRLEGELDLGGFTLASTPLRGEEALWQVDLEPKGGGPPVRIWAESSQVVGHLHVELGLLEADSFSAASSSEWSLGVALTYGDQPLRDYHRQLRILNAIAPGAVVLVDVDACWPRPGSWLRDAASASVPPAPSNLYRIHAVLDPQQPERGAWLHSHGLLRCGSVELELFDVPRESARLLGTLLNTTAGMFLDQGCIPPGEVFMVGHGLELAWVPWQHALVLGEEEVATGGWDDRDPDHLRPAGVLLAPRDEGYENPSCYQEVLDDNPLLYVPAAETERMAQLATERIQTFLSLVQRYAQDEEGAESEDWVFLVKLGYPTGGEREREHLWFRVHSTESYTVDATLLNQPYDLPMQEGERGRHSLEWTTSWQVFSPHGGFDPDTIQQLERRLERG